MLLDIMLSMLESDIPTHTLLCCADLVCMSGALGPGARTGQSVLLLTRWYVKP